ncbi:MAG TPA: hypothetical protein VGK89_03805 [Candidatus Eisenbacteria bacterium]|jgi:hypothetical protein
MFKVGVLTPGSFSSFLLATAVFNGVIYGLAWHLSRLVGKGRRRPLVPVVLVAGFWTSWLVHRTVENWPRPEPPPAPMDLQRGRLDGTTMTIESTVGRMKQMWELQFVRADTGRAGLQGRTGFKTPQRGVG